MTRPQLAILIFLFFRGEREWSVVPQAPLYYFLCSLYLKCPALKHLQFYLFLAKQNIAGLLLLKHILVNMLYCYEFLSLEMRLQIDNSYNGLVPMLNIPDFQKMQQSLHSF